MGKMSKGFIYELLRVFFISATVKDGIIKNEIIVKKNFTGEM